VTTIATANLGNRSDPEVRKGLELLAKQAWVVGVQEAGDRDRMLARFCLDTGWEKYNGNEDGANSTPILFNPLKVEITNQGSRHATPATNCGRLGAGPNVVKPKVFNFVRVKPIAEEKHSDDPFVFINGHWPASLYLRCRRALARNMIADLVDMVENREDKIDVIAVGDFNMIPRSPLTKPLRKQGMIQRTDFRTIDIRTVDHVWTLDRRAEARPFERKFSDHRWVLADVF
jgi:hypothetical protein